MSYSKRHIILLLLLALLPQLWAEPTDSVQIIGHKKVIVKKDTIYQGLCLKLDIANSIIEPVVNAGKRQSYELSLSADLKHRFFPTVELGYASAHQTATLDSLGNNEEQWSISPFGRLGFDIGVIKPKDARTASNNLLLGLRVGMAGPQCDVWGEIHFGVQVAIWKRFMMGWSVRERILFTKDEYHNCFYIPGYGPRKNNRFGFEYYLGIRI